MENLDMMPTNTLALSSFDILKMDAVEDPLININKLATMDLDESYSILAINFINETRKEITDNKITLYKNISESTEQYMVLESFGDFFVKTKDIIDKFLKFIKSLFERFIDNFIKLVETDKYVIKNKNKLKAFATKDEFDFEGFIFTIDPDVPSAQAALDCNDDLFSDLGTENGELTEKSVKDSIQNMNYEKDYDLFRGKVIGKADYPIYTGEFSNELFRVFRNNSNTAEKFTIDSGKVAEMIKDFENYKNIKKQIENDRKEIERVYNTIKKQIQDVVRRNNNLNPDAFLNTLNDIGIHAVAGDGLTMSNELMYQINIFIKNKVDMIQEYSNIHTIAYSAKLDAIKSQYIQERSILYTALQKLQFNETNKEAK